jgi:hypothetical protein
VRATAGVWYRESGDCIRGCDGACFHVVDSLAGAGGWNITNVAALYIFVRIIFASGWDQEGKSFQPVPAMSVDSLSAVPAVVGLFLVSHANPF